MDMFQQDLYPSQEKFKYPKAGEKNSKVSIFIFDTDSNTTKKINEGLNKFEYTPRIYWTKNSEKLCFFKLNRHQNHLKLILTSPKTGKTETVYEEKDQAYIDIHDNITFLDDGFIWTSEKDGFNHIYQFYYNTKEMKQITKGDYEITNFYGYNDKKNLIYFQSNEKSPLQKHIYSIKIDGDKKTILSKKDGINNAVLVKNLNILLIQILVLIHQII